MQKKYFLLVLLISISTTLFSQDNADEKDSSGKKNTVPKDRNMFGHGIPRGLTITSDGLTEGYVMFAVPNSASVYLINRKGEVVHEWKGNYGGPEGSAYLNDDGSISRNAADPDFPVFAGGGEAGRLQRITWDNKIVWDFEYANEQFHTHHDLTVMPNGNVLAIAWEAKTADEVIAAGRKPELIPKAGLWPDKIVEIKPEGERHGTVVWEWHIWDHLIQDYDAKKANYGKPANHPELLDFNVGNKLPPHISQDSLDILIASGEEERNVTPENMGSDVYHFNAVKYNAQLDQIAFSSPRLSEIFIIDHSTTTKEATSHKGGRWGKGGDFLYRWGNPKNYRQGDSSNQKLFGQHDIRWIETGNPDLDQIVFSSPNLSEIFIIDHSTTTKEAASHKGGRSGKGGDLLYRWGNPQNYQRGDSTNRQLFGQHDVRWIEKGKPGAGNLTVFNNHPPGEIDWGAMGNDVHNYSAVYEFSPPMDKNGNYIIEKNKSFVPEKPVWVYTAPDSISFWSSFISGAHRMNNGNTFINEGAKGRFFEVTPDRKIVWEYLNPYHGDIHKPNGDPVNAIPFAYWGFRSTFIPANHPGLANKKLEPIIPQPKPFFLPPPPPGR